MGGVLVSAMLISAGRVADFSAAVRLPVPVLRTLDFPVTSWPASRNLSKEHLAQQIVARGSMAAAILVLLRAPSGVLIWRSMGPGFMMS